MNTFRPLLLDLLLNDGTRRLAEVDEILPEIAPGLVTSRKGRLLVAQSRQMALAQVLVDPRDGLFRRLLPRSFPFPPGEDLLVMPTKSSRKDFNSFIKISLFL